MRKFVLRPLVLAGIVALAATAGASALRLQAGNLLLVTGGGFSPTALPKHEDAPIKLHGFVKIGTVDGSQPSPLRELVLEFDKHGSVETRGLPKCTMGKLVATTTEKARKQCPGAIVGEGFGTAIIEMPEQAPIKTSTPITIFNGPEKHGNPTVIGHGHLDYPAPTTYLVPIEIQKVHHGRYGFKTVATLPRIANDYGAAVYGRLTIGHTWNYRGKTLSYANARCADGRLQAKGEFTFKDGTFLQGTVFKPCTVAPGSK